MKRKKSKKKAAHEKKILLLAIKVACALHDDLNQIYLNYYPLQVSAILSFQKKKNFVQIAIKHTVGERQ